MINNRQNGRRRGRGGGQGGAPRPNGSSGNQDRGNRIDNRARGNAAQLHEKYKALARDSQMQGDRVNTEYYLQFADHYFRVLSESRSRMEEQQPRPRRDDFNQQSEEDYGDEGERGSDDQHLAPPSYMHGADAPRSQGNGQAADSDEDDGRPMDRAPVRVDERRGNYRDDAPSEARAEEEPRPVRRRGRPPKVETSEQIEVDRLPPSFSLTAPVNDAPEAGDKPPRRPRKPRGEIAA